ncbi:MAG: 3-hydroxyanthranilate 3,4-dioxygenase, partial [Actinomycetota bacterium]
MTDYDPRPATDRRPFNLSRWIDEHRDELTPPVANKQVWREADMIVMIVGGGNERNDFHEDPREEFFYQIKGDMNLVIWPGEGNEPFEMEIRVGEVYLLHPTLWHSPLRPDPDSVGLVVEYQRPEG